MSGWDPNICRLGLRPNLSCQPVKQNKTTLIWALSFEPFLEQTAELPDRIGLPFNGGFQSHFTTQQLPTLDATVYRLFVHSPPRLYWGVAQTPVEILPPDLRKWNNSVRNPSTKEKHFTRIINDQTLNAVFTFDVSENKNIKVILK